MKIWCVIIADSDGDPLLIVKKDEKAAIKAVKADVKEHLSGGEVTDEQVNAQIKAAFINVGTLVEACCVADDLLEGRIEYFPEEREI